MAYRIIFGFGERAVRAMRGRLGREEGQTFVEYTLVILVVAVVLVTGAFVEPFRNAIEGAMDTIADTITGADDDGGGGGGG
jgi:Flp pilus assembly pilin Flp